MENKYIDFWVLRLIYKNETNHELNYRVSFCFDMDIWNHNLSFKENIDYILSLSAYDILKIPNIGKKSLKELEPFIKWIKYKNEKGLL